LAQVGKFCADKVRKVSKGGMNWRSDTILDKRGGIGRTPHLMCNWYSDSTAGLTRLQAKLLKLWQSRFAPSKNLDNIVKINFAVVPAIGRRKFKHRGNKIRSIE